MKIDVRIPYEPGGRLGQDYNRIMRETIHDWVLLLDHDIFLLNPNWYHICQEAIKTHPKAGIITCRTNAPHRTGQHDDSAPAGSNIGEHQCHARQLWMELGWRVTPLSKTSGYFMLVNKAAWRAVGGFPGEGMYKEDWTFSKRLHKAGWPLLCLDGLYVYHHKARTGTWVDGDMTAKEIQRREEG
jgi:GT2 family glycosyltransferase